MPEPVAFVLWTAPTQALRGKMAKKRRDQERGQFIFSALKNDLTPFPDRSHAVTNSRDAAIELSSLAHQPLSRGKGLFRFCFRAQC